MEQIVAEYNCEPDLSLFLFVWQVWSRPPRVTGVGPCGQFVDRSLENGFKPGVVGLGEDGTKDCVMAHTHKVSPRKKQPWGPQ